MSTLPEAVAGKLSRSDMCVGGTRRRTGGHRSMNELGKGHQITRTACAVVAAISLALTALGVLTLAEEEIQQTDLMDQQIGE